ncbi:Mur ligase domain-containing protein, partial [Maricaulis sp.]|uniref:Mur ligase domain-containing protein n=1 Tax=Maricaulis sp. TaxID=1486257 RepID=UPI000C6360A5
MSEPSANPLWTSGQAMAATGGMLIGEPGWTVSGISIDTRTLQPGDLFVALQDARDGHDFVAAAMEKGASACLVERGDTGVEPALMVKDALK